MQLSLGVWRAWKSGVISRTPRRLAPLDNWCGAPPTPKKLTNGLRGRDSTSGCGGRGGTNRGASCQTAARHPDLPPAAPTYTLSSTELHRSAPKHAKIHPNPHFAPKAIQAHPPNCAKCTTKLHPNRAKPAPSRANADAIPRTTRPLHTTYRCTSHLPPNPQPRARSHHAHQHEPILASSNSQTATCRSPFSTLTHSPRGGYTFRRPSMAAGTPFPHTQTHTHTHLARGL